MITNSILTYNNGIIQGETYYFSPLAVYPGTSIPIENFYLFVSRVLPWSNESAPPTPQQTQKYLKEVHKNIFFLKRISTNDICLVTKRIDWATGTVYDYYSDSVDMFTRDNNLILTKKFYVKNKYDQVFKCLWNNNGAASTVEPFFEPGTFNPNLIFQGADNYKWKYIYTINPGLKVKFMDSNWIPVPIISDPRNNNLNPAIRPAGAGSIDVINVTNSGSGYDPTNSVISVVITGDGTGASANAIISNGEITDINVVNPGTNYSYANVAIISTTGANAVAIAPTSPVGGHGSNPISELGATNLMVTATLNGSENSLLPTDIDYRQIGILVNPTARSTSPNPANGVSYRASTDCILGLGAGTYINDEIIYQSPDGSLAKATFTARCLSFNVTTNVIKLINIVGTPTLNAPLYGYSSGTARTLSQVQIPDYITFSGFITYIENRTAVQRDPDGAEQVKIVYKY